MFRASYFKRFDYLLLIFLSAVLLPFVLFIFRSLDNNRLTSWNWAFTAVEPATVFSSLILSLFAAMLIARSSVFERHPAGFLLALSFLACIPMWREPEVIVDASRYFTQAKHLALYGIRYFLSAWGGDIVAWTDMPLVPFLYGLIFRLFGESRLPVQIFNTTLFSLTVVMTYRLGTSLRDGRTGLYGGLLLLGIPYLFSQVPLMLTDTATMFLVTLSVFTFLNALRHGGIWVPLSAASIFAALFCKYSTWPMLSVLAVIGAVQVIQGMRGNGQTASGTVLLRGLTVAACTLPLIIIAYLQFSDVIREQMNLLVMYQKPALKRWGESYLSTFFYQIHPFITLAAVASAYTALKERDISYVIVLWPVMFMFILGGWRIRYLSPVFPMLALLASYGLLTIKDEVIVRFIAFSAVLSSIVIAVFLYLPFLQKMSASNLRDAGVYLNTLDAPAAEIITLPADAPVIHQSVSVPVLDLFTSKNLSYDFHPEEDLPEKARTSPLRFSWTFRNPAYYRNTLVDNDTPLVIITSDYEVTLPHEFNERLKHYEKLAEFSSTTDLFQYSPRVFIYTPAR